jgi:cysteinyl-tRNA synthetase
MAWRYLGETFDIHAGGSDLLFPHHENERAQSLCAFKDSGFARIWIHNGMVRVEGQKMSKSLGNFTTVRDALMQAPGEAIRFMLLRTHYRAPLDFTARALRESRRELDRLYRALGTDADVGTVPAVVLERLCDDLNTPLAISALHELADAALSGDAQARSQLKVGGASLGLLRAEPEEWFRRSVDGAAVEAAIAERFEARKTRNFARADAIRAELAEWGVVLEDSEHGTTWRVN